MARISNVAQASQWSLGVFCWKDSRASLVHLRWSVGVLWGVCKPTVEYHLQARGVNTCSHQQLKVSENSMVMAALLVCLLVHSICFLLAVRKVVLLFAVRVLRLWAPSSPAACCGWKHISSWTLHSSSCHIQRPAHISLMAIDLSQNDSHQTPRCFGKQCALTCAVRRCTAPRAVFLTVPRDVAYQHPSVQTRVLDHWAVSPAAASRYCRVRGYARVTAGNGCRWQSGKEKVFLFHYIRSSYRCHSVIALYIFSFPDINTSCEKTCLFKACKRDLHV